MRASDSNFLFAPPGALDDAQISKLEDAGVIVVVSERWSDLKIVRAAPMLPTGDFIAAAGKAISVSEYAQRAFGVSVSELMQQLKGWARYV